MNAERESLIMPTVKFELSTLDAVQWLRDLPTESVDRVVTELE